MCSIKITNTLQRLIRLRKREKEFNDKLFVAEARVRGLPTTPFFSTLIRYTGHVSNQTTSVLNCYLLTQTQF